MNSTSELKNKNSGNFIDYIKFLMFSVLGVILFFTPITINGTRSIPLDHLITYINQVVPKFGEVITLIIATVGGLLPWIKKTYRKDSLNFVLSAFRFLGIPLCFMAFFERGPEWLMEQDMLPFVWKNISVAVTMIVIIGSIFLTFIIGYGLLEFTGVLVRPVMRPVYKVPGKAAINAVAAFIGSFSVAMFLTDKIYKESKYTFREAAIVMTGFSTVSATFMIVIAKTAQFMDIWNFYFWSTLVITFIVTAFSVRLYPITKLDNSYVDGVGKPELPMAGNIFVNAVKEGVRMAASSKSLLKNLWDNLKGGVMMCFVLTPTSTTIGMLALILVNMTPVFDYVGYLFYPVTWLLSLFGLAESLMVAKASAVVLGEVFVPNLIVSSLSAVARYIIAVVSVSSIVFFAGFIPCLYATSIKLKPWQLLLIWFERAVLSVILAGIVGLIFIK